MQALPVKKFKIVEGILDLARELEMNILTQESIGSDGDKIVDYYLECTAKEYAELNAIAKEFEYV